MKFSLHQYADISTGYVADSDLELLLRVDAPLHVANVDDGHGSFFYVPAEPDLLESSIADSRKFGFSEQFVTIIQALFEQKIPYARFDADGAYVEGLGYHDDNR